MEHNYLLAASMSPETGLFYWIDCRCVFRLIPVGTAIWQIHIRISFDSTSNWARIWMQYLLLFCRSLCWYFSTQCWSPFCDVAVVNWCDRKMQSRWKRWAVIIWHIRKLKIRYAMFTLYIHKILSFFCFFMLQQPYALLLHVSHWHKVRRQLLLCYWRQLTRRRSDFMLQVATLIGGII